ncbi:CinA family protein [Pedobacter antarcticus]|nr:nicotinamide-nucleotide amidohydrolase family protein [Pedobacter antarcticus]SDL38189.1 competence/damage-inducible protein cinA [Pedobacter antarcticus]SFE46173.1 nicotinamide-nucleotide amidase [Pedobacter antarcticus]
MSNSEMKQLIETAAKLLIRSNLTLAFAESATAGKASAAFSLACDAGRFLQGGFVCYNAKLKSDVLHVKQEMLDKFSPESTEVTDAITRGLTGLIPADIHIGITGLPCPGGSETPEKPVGTMFISAILKGEHWFSERLLFHGSHEQIVEQTVMHVATKLINSLHNPAPVI